MERTPQELTAPLTYQEYRDKRHHLETEGSASEQAAWNERNKSISRVLHENETVYVADPVVGMRSIDDELMRDLLQIERVRRLFGVQQFGDGSAVWNLLLARPHTRGEHSLGTTVILVDKLAEIDQPCDENLVIAAMTHDVGMPVLSHHGEAAFDRSPEQSWHDRQRHIALSDERYGLKGLIEGHDYTVEDIIELQESHPLLNRELPGLDVDRIHYILLDSLATGLIDERVTQELLDAHHIHLRPDAGCGWSEWYTDNLAAGMLMHVLMSKLNKDYYTEPAMYEIKRASSSLLRHAMDRGYLETEDVVKGTDQSVFDKLETVRRQVDPEADPEFHELLQTLEEFRVPRTHGERIAFIMEKAHDTVAEQSGAKGRRAFRKSDLKTTKHRWVIPLVEHPRNGRNTPKEIQPLTYWLKRGCNPFPIPDHPFAVAAERLEPGIIDSFRAGRPQEIFTPVRPRS